MQDYELKEILEGLGLGYIKPRNGRKGLNFTFSCPNHRDRRPSAGMVLDGQSVYGGCFSCKAKWTLPQLVATCLDITVWEAVQYINEKFNLESRTVKKSTQLKEYGTVEKKYERFTLPIVKIAPFKSGKVTHNYFFSRGFTADTVKEHLIGWDRIKKRITLPVFHQDGVLAGIIGRAVFEMDTWQYEEIYGEEPKYLIYERFPIGDVLLGSHRFNGDKTAIIVEGSFDYLWMHQCGFGNTLSTIISNFTERQRDILFSLGVEEIVLFYDNDAAGRKANAIAYDLLKPFFKVYSVTYPKPENEDDDVKDPMHLNKEQITYMIDNKAFYWKKPLVRRGEDAS